MTPTILFKCLADETRLSIILLLMQHRSLCVCELHETLAMSQPKVSRHLAELRRCELLSSEKNGKWVYYQINADLPLWAQGILQATFKHCQAEQPQLLPAKVPTSC